MKDLETYTLTKGPTKLTYEFISHGKHGRILKNIEFTKMNIPGIYNLSLVDIDEKLGNLGDLVRSANGDMTKVLSTVAMSVQLFLEEFPNALVFAKGSTPARTRLYRMGITKNISLFSADFNILGLQKNEMWVPFEKNKHFEGFLIKRKSNFML